MTTSSIYGGVSQTSGLYGTPSTYGGATYFQWFIFQINSTAPSTPTGGSWNFTTNTGTPPTGWLINPPTNPTNLVWVSYAIVNSRTPDVLTWSTPGQYAYSSGAGLPILVASVAPGSGDGFDNQLYIQTNTTPQTMWIKETGIWTKLTGSSIYLTVTGGVSGGTF
jgi:hypothetical protein